MKLIVELDYDARDKMMVDMLTEDYENLYYNYQHDLERGKANIEDLRHNEETLDALECILDYYTPRDEHLAIIDRIQNKLTIKRDIARKMGMKSS
jgi:hypothetical protein